MPVLGNGIGSCFAFTLFGVYLAAAVKIGAVTVPAGLSFIPLLVCLLINGLAYMRNCYTSIRLKQYIYVAPPDIKAEELYVRSLLKGFKEVTDTPNNCNSVMVWYV